MIKENQKRGGKVGQDIKDDKECQWRATLPPLPREALEMVKWWKSQP